MEKNFFQPRRLQDSNRFELDVKPQHCVHTEQHNFLMGGVNLAACIYALEQVTQQPLICASAQFISQASKGERVSIDIDIPVAGRNVTQARARAHKDGQELMAVMASLGQRSGYPEMSFVRKPDNMPPPEQCPQVSETDLKEDVRGQIEKRAVPKTPEGTELKYIRLRHPQPMSSGLLAVVADFLAGGHELTQRSSSLDNMLRIYDVRPSEWLVCETQFSGFRAGMFHGHMYLYNMDGALMATAGQSGRLPVTSKL